MSETVNTLSMAIGCTFGFVWVLDACAYLVDVVDFFKK